MAALSELWTNHPNIKGDAPLLDKKVYENQCAINLPASLMRSGIDMKTFAGARSWEKDKPSTRSGRKNWLARTSTAS